MSQCCCCLVSISIVIIKRSKSEQRPTRIDSFLQGAMTNMMSAGARGGLIETRVAGVTSWRRCGEVERALIDELFRPLFEEVALEQMAREIGGIERGEIAARGSALLRSDEQQLLLLLNLLLL